MTMVSSFVVTCFFFVSHLSLVERVAKRSRLSCALFLKITALLFLLQLAFTLLCCNPVMNLKMFTLYIFDSVKASSLWNLLIASVVYKPLRVVSIAAIVLQLALSILLLSLTANNVSINFYFVWVFSPLPFVSQALLITNTYLHWGDTWIFLLVCVVTTFIYVYIHYLILQSRRKVSKSASHSNTVADFSF